MIGRCGSAPHLDAYQTLGGVQGAIAAKLALVLSDPEPTAEEVEALQRAFTRYLIRVDEGAVEGERLLRRVVPRASLPQAADRLIGRLVDAGLLMAKDGTIELAHERLIGDWPQLPLKTWLTQDATDRRLIDQLRQRVETTRCRTDCWLRPKSCCGGTSCWKTRSQTLPPSSNEPAPELGKQPTGSAGGFSAPQSQRP